ncbi:MAG TPA: hypothetical protein VFP54_12530 [Acidimicrobiales bacterium]|nr:hypothetical protein [Acidimicrobiales bacterium]
MTTVALCSAKGSPGATTTAQLTANSWPAGRRLLVVEADPAGGDLAARLGLHADPGMVSLASEGRRGLTASVVDAHAQAVGDEVVVLLGPAGGRAATAAVTVLADRLVEAMTATTDRDVLMDCGRMSAGSPAWPLARSADTVAIVVGSTAADVAHTASLVEDLIAADANVGLVVVGEAHAGGDRYPAPDISEALGCPILATLPHEPRVAGALALGRYTGRALSRSRLARAAADLSGRLTAPTESPSPAPRPIEVRDLPTLEPMS